MKILRQLRLNYSVPSLDPKTDSKIVQLDFVANGRGLSLLLPPTCIYSIV